MPFSSHPSNSPANRVDGDQKAKEPKIIMN